MYRAANRYLIKTVNVSAIFDSAGQHSRSVRALLIGSDGSAIVQTDSNSNKDFATVGRWARRH
jgi:hypothetical protein